MMDFIINALTDLTVANLQHRGESSANRECLKNGPTLFGASWDRAQKALCRIAQVVADIAAKEGFSSRDVHLRKYVRDQYMSWANIRKYVELITC